MNKEFLYRKVMIVDDSKMDRIISSTIIKRNWFAEDADSFSNVAEALDYLQSIVNKPDVFPPVIFLDVNMPVLDGFDFLDGYLKLPNELQRRCTVIMISATNSEEDLERINNYPSVRMFFNKPLSDRILFDIRKNIKTGVYIKKVQSGSHDVSGSSRD